MFLAVEQDEIGVAAHQLQDEVGLDRLSHFVGAVKAQTHQPLQQKELVRHEGSSIEPQVEGTECADQQNCSADY